MFTLLTSHRVCAENCPHLSVATDNFAPHCHLHSVGLKQLEQGLILRTQECRNGEENKQLSGNTEFYTRTGGSYDEDVYLQKTVAWILDQCKGVIQNEAERDYMEVFLCDNIPLEMLHHRDFLTAYTYGEPTPVKRQDDRFPAQDRHRFDLEDFRAIIEQRLKRLRPIRPSEIESHSAKLDTEGTPTAQFAPSSFPTEFKENDFSDLHTLLTSLRAQKDAYALADLCIRSSRLHTVCLQLYALCYRCDTTDRERTLRSYIKQNINTLTENSVEGMDIADPRVRLILHYKDTADFPVAPQERVDPETARLIGILFG